ncbi:YdcF family protein [Streptomyces canus]|uniref:YdcF family protein n=1 Tax=Streptomyces canus TaxID=58343 RepID=UPI002DD83E2E|nr:YdcF family protein [Streptomyces canus]WSD83064.1 YdcF family protein [Streptomyces canus]
MPTVILAILAGLAFLLFLARTRQDPRRFGNAVLLGLSLVLLTLALLAQVAAGSAPAPLLAAVTLAFVLLALGVLALAFFLIANGVTMVRKEGRRPANLLSGLAGLAVLGCVTLTVTAADLDSAPLRHVAGAVLLVAGYVSYVFLSFLAYAFLYARLKVRHDVDFVVVLGSGLVGGSRVPPLLASRLERAHAVYEAQAARGTPPVLVTSGGQGPDEDLPEAEAMADHLIGRGVPERHVVRENRSRTTEENLRFSEALMRERVPDHRCVVVTNNFHVFRAALTARRTGVNGQVIGSPTAAYFWPSATIREFAAIFLHYRAVNLGSCALLALIGFFPPS